MKKIVCACAALLAACSSNPPAPDWQMNAKSSSERAVAAYLSGNARIDMAEQARARAEVARTGRADLLARVELAHCAAQAASLVFEACAAFEPLRAWFQALYEVLLGQTTGPRFGSFVAIFGLDRTLALMEERLALAA